MAKKSRANKDLLQVGIWAVIAIMVIVIVVTYFLR